MTEKGKLNQNGEQRKKLVRLGVSVGAVLLVVGFFYYLRASAVVSTDDANIEGHVIPVSSKVAGRVETVRVNDNEDVEEGKLLVEIDSRDYEAKLRMQKAEVLAARAEEEEAMSDWKRYETLAQKDEVSRQQLDKTKLRLDTAHARSERAAAGLEAAELDLSYTKITAPAAGRVTRKSVENGAYVQVGQPLLAIVPPERWIVANFKETQLTRMKPGQSVRIKVDTYPGVRFVGHVDSVQYGTGARFSLLPPENATGNFVKVVQRVPIKILFDGTPDPDHPLAVGMSVVPEVKVR